MSRLFATVNRWLGGRPSAAQPPPALETSGYAPSLFGGEEDRAAGGPRGVLLPAFLPYYNDQTGETPAIRRAYRLMLSEPNVKAPLFAKIFSVAALDLQVHPFRKRDLLAQEHAEFTRWAFTERLEGGVAGMVWDMLSGGLVDGFSILERVWGPPSNEGRWGGKTQLVRLRPVDVAHDLVMVLDQYRRVVSLMGLRYNAGVNFDPADFVIYTHLPMYGAPTGMSELRAAYGTYFILDCVRKLRAWGAEKRAIPLAYGEYPNNDPAKKAALEAGLKLLKSQNWLAVPTGVQLKILDMAGASNDYFQTFQRDCVQDIVFSISGATLQAMQGAEGSNRGSSDVHRETAALGPWWTSARIGSLLNDRGPHGLVKDLIDRNYAQVDGYPRLTFGGVDPAKQQGRLTLATGLNNIGFDLSKNQMAEEMGFNMPEGEDDVLPGKPASAAPATDAATPGASPFEEPVTRRFAEEWDEYVASRRAR